MGHEQAVRSSIVPSTVNRSMRMVERLQLRDKQFIYHILPQSSASSSSQSIASCSSSSFGVLGGATVPTYNTTNSSFPPTPVNDDFFSPSSSKSCCCCLMDMDAALLDFSCSAKLIVCLRSRSEVDSGRSGCTFMNPIADTAFAMAAATLCCVLLSSSRVGAVRVG